MVTDLAGGIMDADNSPYFFVVGGEDYAANPVEDEDVLDIWVLMRYLQDILHLFFILGQHRTL